jgi:hypothetical protein
MLENRFCVFLRYFFSVTSRVFDLLDLLDRLELDEEDDRVDLVVVQTLNRLKVDPQNAMLVLKENIFFNKLVFLLFFKQKVINI